MGGVLVKKRCSKEFYTNFENYLRGDDHFILLKSQVKTRSKITIFLKMSLLFLYRYFF